MVWHIDEPLITGKTSRQLAGKCTLSASYLPLASMPQLLKKSGYTTGICPECQLLPYSEFHRKKDRESWYQIKSYFVSIIPVLEIKI